MFSCIMPHKKQRYAGQRARSLDSNGETPSTENYPAPISGTQCLCLLGAIFVLSCQSGGPLPVLKRILHDNRRFDYIPQEGR